MNRTKTETSMKPEPVKVAFCENGAGYGGAVISLVAFLEIIPQRYRPLLYTGIGTEPYQQLSRLGQWRHLPAIGLLDRKRLRRSGLPYASMLDNIFNLLPYALRHYRAFRRDGIELVYLNNDCSCNLAAAVGGKLAGLPLVLHSRGFNSDTRGNRWLLQQLDHCIAVSQAVRTQLLELGLPPEKCTVVAEGLDLRQFQPRVPDPALREELGIAPDAPVITLVGGLVDWKGQDVLLDAAPHILAAFPDAWILMVGSAYGKDDTFALEIARRAADPALRGRVRLLGARKDIPAILATSSVILHASTQPEPFGRTFLEGMAMGRPTIASNEGGPLDVIDHETDGLLIAPRDPGTLAGAVVRLLSDPALAATLARNGARKAIGYSIEHHTAAIAAVLDATMQARGRPQPLTPQRTPDQ